MEEENKPKDNKNKMIMIAVVAIVVIVIVAVGGFVFAGDRLSTSVETEVSHEDSSMSDEDSEFMEEESGEVMSDGDVKTFDMTAEQWEFTPSTITVNQFDFVRLNITSVDVTHGFTISDFGVNETLVPNSTTTVEFSADKKGTFRFFCSVSCGAGHASMDGTLIVE